jgi:predicted small metal-binding protein
MSHKLRTTAKAQQLVVRCECGMVLRASHEEALVEKVRLHMGEFHPEVGANIPADLILAMAEQKEN